MVDELQLHVVPELIGGGERVFTGTRAGRLEQLSHGGSDIVTHLRYRLRS